MRARASALQMALVVKNLPASEGDARDTGLVPELGRLPGGGQAATPVFLPRKAHGQRGPGKPQAVGPSQTQLSTPSQANGTF